MITISTYEKFDAKVFEFAISNSDLINLDLSLEEMLRLKEVNETGDIIRIAEGILMLVKKIVLKQDALRCPLCTSDLVTVNTDIHMLYCHRCLETSSYKEKKNE